MRFVPGALSWGGPAEIEFIGQANSATNGSPYSLGSFDYGGGTIIAAIAHNQGITTDVSIGGETASSVVTMGDNTALLSCDIWKVNSSPAKTGAAVAITLSGSPLNCYVALYRLRKLRSKTAVESNSARSGGGLGNAALLNFDIPADGVCLAIAAAWNNVPTGNDWTYPTEDDEQAVSSELRATAASIATPTVFSGTILTIFSGFGLGLNKTIAAASFR